MKIAICFFGQVKNYDQTIFDAYENNIERILFANDCSIDRYLVTYNNTWFSNPRNNEDGPIDYLSILEYLSFTQYHIIDINAQMIKDLDSFSLSLVEKYGGSWQEHSELSTVFAVRQLYSLKIMYELLSNHIYDRYIFLRPDALFINSIDIRYITDNSYDILTPAFDQYCGFNDRFAITSRSGMIEYANRYTKLIQQPLKYHSENFLKKTIVESETKHNTIDNFVFKLIRTKND